MWRSLLTLMVGLGGAVAMALGVYVHVVAHGFTLPIGVVVWTTTLGGVYAWGWAFRLERSWTVKAILVLSAIPPTLVSGVGLGALLFVSPWLIYEDSEQFLRALFCFTFLAACVHQVYLIKREAARRELAELE